MNDGKYMQRCIQFAEWVNNAQPTTWSRNMNWWLTDLDLTNNNAAPTIPSGDE